MIMQVHDELVFEIDDAALEAARKSIADIMQSVVKLKVPLIVDTGTGGNWATAH